MLAFVRMGLKQTFAFPARLLADLVRPVVAIILYTSVVASVSALSGTKTLMGMNVYDLMLYYAAVQLVGALPTFEVAFEFAERINNGHVAKDLTLPVHPHIQYFLSSLGRVLPAFLWNTVLLLALTLYSGRIWNIFGFFAMFFAASIFGVLLNATIGLISVWTYRIGYIRSVVAWFLPAIFGGGLVPVHVLPEPLKTITLYLPFRYSAYEVGMALLKGFDILAFVALLGWSLVLWIVYCWLWGKAKKRLEALGG